MQDRDAEATGLEITKQRLPELGPAAKAKVEAEVNRGDRSGFGPIECCYRLAGELASSPTDAAGAS